jgi:NAD(P)-dependent dehydrogenase (short-subunit alcohol dehydrogenase family)
MLNNGAPTLLPTQEDLHSYAANVPINRMGTPEDVAKIVVLLASDAAGFITGQRF